MTVSVALDDDDLALVEVLQRNPRARWTDVAEVVGTNAVTARRRWERLRSTGAAWVTGTPGWGTYDAQCLAYVDVTCEPRAKTQVAEEVAKDVHALSVDITAGTSDLLVTVAARDLVTLGRYLLERLDRVDGVTATRTRIATRLHTEGSLWRLGVLPPGRLEPAPRPFSRTSPLSPLDRDLLTELGADGRASYAALAEATGTSQPTARRRVDRLISSGAVLLRTEVAGPLAGWPVSVVLWADAAAGHLDEVASQVARLRQVRLCATLASTPSLVVVAWLTSLDEVHRFEQALVQDVAGVQVLDRLVVLRAVKRMGHLLDAQGCATSSVSMDVWRDPAPDHAPDHVLDHVPDHVPGPVLEPVEEAG